MLGEPSLQHPCWDGVWGRCPLRPSAGWPETLGDHGSLGKPARRGLLPALLLHRLGEISIARSTQWPGLRPSPPEKSILKWRVAAPCGWEGREGEARGMLRCFTATQALPMPAFPPALGTLEPHQLGAALRTHSMCGTGDPCSKNSCWPSHPCWGPEVSGPPSSCTHCS